MKFTTSKICAAIALSTLALCAHAESPDASLWPSQATLPSNDQGPMRSNSVENRSDVRSQVRMAVADGSMPRGEQSTARQGKAPAPITSAVQRVDVLFDAIVANMTSATPKGEESVIAQASASGG